ncbi:diacylglycerol kinase eta-like isoform X2 [Daktulosphaira vitifoliae]|uniref:diacylglycerol kinase eta-like isoform X2 n=1 Tax=Daktulosphaira vitifoliae TaxID=58002 RepID=UPI0021AA9853|nr:diacylglycerol kinase eta-like isoform X2 [Daktulosphaira vitifoliae]
MEDWIAAMKVTDSRDILNQPLGTDLNDFLSGNHSWHTTSHARPTYCNICRDQLSGVTSHGFSCEICKCKVHKRCVNKAISNCKWTTLASIGKDIIEDKHGNILMPHQWMEGNLPVSSKCSVCDKTCGSVLRLQDWRCLWCRATVHTACRPKHTVKCPLGTNRLSVVPPTVIHSVGNDDTLEAIQPQGCSPLLVFVNSKSGDNQGVKFLRRFKQLLNPAQVFDLIGNGPGPGLRLFRHFNPFRVLVCSGDGSVGWVLSEIDRLNMQVQCQVGVLPLGTGNDLARVLGWGASCDADTHITQILEKYERASTKMLDRWSIMVYERSIDIGSDTKLTINSGVQDSTKIETSITNYYNTIMKSLSIILQSNQYSTIIDTAKNLCDTVKEFIICITEYNMGTNNCELNNMQQDLRYKLDRLLQLIQKEEFKMSYDQNKEENFVPIHIVDNNSNINEVKNNKIKLNKNNSNNKLMYKAKLFEQTNSFKKSVTKLIEHSEKIQNVFLQNSCQSTIQESTSIDDKTNFQFLKTQSIVNPMSISPIPTERRDSACSLDLNIESLPAPIEFADSRQETITEDQNAVLSEEDTSTYQMSQYDDLNSYCQMYESDKIKIENNELIKLCSFKICDEESMIQIGHIDSSEASDEAPNSFKTYDNKCTVNYAQYSFRQSCKSSLTCHIPKTQFSTNECIESDLDANNLISSSPEDEESEDFHKELRITDNVPKKCSIAHFIEGNDIARRSIKCRHVNRTYSDMEADSQFTFKSIKEESTKTNKSLGLELLDISNIKTEINVRIQGSNSNLSKNGDGERLTYAQNTKSLNDPLFDDEDEEIKKLKTLKRSITMNGPAVVIDPPSPQNFTSNQKCDIEVFHLDFRRNSFDSCRRLSAASPIMLNASPLRSSHKISSSTALHTRNTSPTLFSTFKESSLKSGKTLPIINPLVTLPTWPNVAESSLISQVLLANADALCAPAVPLMDPDETLLEGFFEKCIMNNYFGIGIDAKISLDFHHKREEHPEKCRSRTRNYMWYGVLGSKQWLQKTYKNLDQRVQLECDGQRIPLPSLQGIVILNIPSFMGGTNFWGGTKEDRIFLAPSFDDRILEVVAVFGTIQMAASRLINLQHHRIAQCTTIQINILGDEGVPVQVDGEAWIQPPGMIRIIHKNRMKMLCRNKTLELSLKSWEEKQKQIKCQNKRAQSQSLCKYTPLSEEEWKILQDFLDAAMNLIGFIKEILLRQVWLEGENLKKLIETIHENIKKISVFENKTKEKEIRSVATDIVLSTRRLHEETLGVIRTSENVFGGELVIKLTLAFSQLEEEFKKCLISSKDSDNYSTSAYVYFMSNSYESDKLSRKGQFWQRKWSKSNNEVFNSDITKWSIVEVGIWLKSIQISEYTELFINNDIRGKELLNLSRRDLKEMGITKVGHIKRILMAVKELNMFNEDH